MNKVLKIVIVILIGWGLMYNIAFIFSFDKKYPEEGELDAIVKVVSMKKEKEKSNSYTVKILSSNMNHIENTKIILYTSKNSEFTYGDILKISGDFSQGDVARNYKGFNYRNYLKQSKIYGSMYMKEPERVGSENGIFEKVYALKKNCYQVIEKIYEEDESSFLKGILLGDSSNLSDDIKENFRDSSMSHVLAISGMHISYILIGINSVLDKFLNSRKLKNYSIIVILFFFATITGASPSCVRACIMNGMLLISQNFYRKNNFYVSIFFTFMILLFMNPYNIFSVGMWLSFFGTLGIVLFQKFFKRLIECKYKIKSRFFKSLLDIFLVSFSAQILILPVMVYCFNTVSLTFFVSNLLIYFLVGPLLALGYISVISGCFFLELGRLMGVFETFLIVVIFKIAEICSKLPFSKIYLPTPDLWMLFLYYAIIAIGIFYFTKNKMKFLRFLLGDGIRKFTEKYWKKIGIVLIIIVLLCKFIAIFPANLKIYFVDVGQGDCAVVKSPTNKTIIVDGGNNQDYDYGENVVVPYLLDRKITKIDFLMVSHFDSDHCGGLFAVLENLSVKNIIIGKQDNVYKNCTQFLELAKKKKVNIIVAEAGNVIKIDKYCYFHILWPNGQEMIADNGINNNSLMAKLVYGDFSMLFTGDIEKIAEEKIIQMYEKTGILNSNILKVAHHGSKSSSIQEMVEMIKPQIAVIGVGSDNRYGHPNVDVIQRLKSYGGKAYRTDKNGEIMIEVNHKSKLKVRTILE